MTGRRRLRTRSLVAMGAVLTGLCLVAGCSSTDSNEPAPQGAAREETADRQSAVGSAEQPPATGSATDQQARALPAERAVVYTADLTVRVDDVAAARQQAIQIVTTASGEVTAEDSSTAPADAAEKGGRVRLTMRVPPERFRQVLDELAGLGTRVQVTQSATDVTAEVVDVESRIASQRRSVERVRALLDQATSISDVVAIEAELARREAELESLQARAAALQAQTAFATVTVELLGPAESVDDQDDRGFLAGLGSGWQSLQGAVAVILTVLGWLLPFSVAVAGLGLPLWWLARRWRRRTAVPTPATATSPPAP